MKHIVPALRRNLSRSAVRDAPPIGQKRLDHAPASPSLTISVASYNVHKCVGNDGVFDPDRVLEVVLELDADIVALQEADQRFGSRKGLLDLKALHERGGYASVLDEGSRRLRRSAKALWEKRRASPPEQERPRGCRFRNRCARRLRPRRRRRLDRYD
jgi:hypothetical protein